MERKQVPRIQLPSPDPLAQTDLTIRQSLSELEAYTHSLKEAKRLKEQSERRLREARALLAIVARADRPKDSSR